MRDKDVRGIRKLSVLLPRWILPAPESVGNHVLMTLHGFSLIIDPSIDKGVEQSLFETGTYEKGILHFIKNNLKSDGCFVDVGANIGLMSIFTAIKFPNSKVVAFEAHPHTLKILEENIRLNEVKNIQIQPLALSNTSGLVTIFDNWNVNRGGASIKLNKGESNSHQVNCNLLDSFTSIAPSMIKIDVEGAELEVLLGAKNTIETYRPTLIIEISKGRDQLDESKEIYDFLISLGFYSLYKLKGGKERKSKLVPILSLADLPDHDNIICISQV